MVNFWEEVCLMLEAMCKTPIYITTCLPSALFRNTRLFIILFVRKFWRVCSQFWLSVRNSVWGPLNRISRGIPSLCWLEGGGGLRGTKIVNKILWSFRNEFPEKLHFSYKKYFSGINFQKITYHVFVCDSENYMEKCFWNYFLGKTHFSYMKSGFRN